jgi:transcriptional regulator GlxA family with amidase domain
LAGLLAAVAYTYLYIKRIQRQHQQTLKAYLTLLNQPEGGVAAADATEPVVAAAVKAEDDVLLKRVMKFIEENISDADIGVGDLAAAAAVSRSGLQRKLKQTMGVTPQELLREARIKRACHLLRHTSNSIADVAYSCGFTDPKYFSRCFRQSTGQSPSEYKTSGVKG